MLSDRERSELLAIEQVLARDDPRLAQLLTQGRRQRIGRAAGWLLVAAVPTVAAGFVHIALGLLVAGATVIVVTMIILCRV